MSSARCPDCSVPLLMKMDGSSAVCPNCGREFPCTESEHTPSAASIPSQRLVQLTSAFEDSLGQFLAQKCNIDALLSCCQDVSQLPKSYQNILSERFAYDLMDACRKKKPAKLWKPLLQGIMATAPVFPETQYQKVMCCALTSVGNDLISPVEQALVNWRRHPEMQKNEAKALEILESCNNATRQVLDILDWDFISKHQELFENPLTELFERLNSISWDVESLTCLRPTADNPRQYERYPFLSNTSHIAQRSTLFQNRSIVDNRKYQLRHSCNRVRQQRKDTYWQAHPEQRAELENRWVELRMNIAALRRKISLSPQITRMQEIQNELNQLAAESASLGLLQYRQKMELRARETALNEEFSRLDLQFNELEKETQNQIYVLQEELDRVTKELDGVVS